MFKLSKSTQKKADAWADRVKAEGLEVGNLVSAMRVITNSADHILHSWWEPAIITEVRTFDAVVRFQDGTTSSSGLGLKEFSLPVVAL
jgi:hypothetical protein